MCQVHPQALRPTEDKSFRRSRKPLQQYQPTESEPSMPRRVLMQRGGETFDLLEVPAPDEHHLQEVMKGQPQLIPSDDLGLE